MLFTQDDDLLTGTTQRQRRGQSFHGVIYAHQLRVPISDCIHDLELIAKVGKPADMSKDLASLCKDSHQSSALERSTDRGVAPGSACPRARVFLWYIFYTAVNATRGRW